MLSFSVHSGALQTPSWDVHGAGLSMAPLSAGIQKGTNCSPKVFNGILAQMPDKWNPYGKYSIGRFGTNGFTDDAFRWPLLASVYTIAPPLLLFVSGGIPETKSKKKKSLVYDRRRGNTSSEFIKNARNMLKILSCFRQLVEEKRAINRVDMRFVALYSSS